MHKNYFFENVILISDVQKIWMLINSLLNEKNEGWARLVNHPGGKQVKLRFAYTARVYLLYYIITP